MATLAFLQGGLCVCSAAISLFFFRYWKKTLDRLFLFFSAAFLALAMERIILQFASLSSELAPFVYTIRLCAFLLIIGAIFDRNRRQ